MTGSGMGRAILSGAVALFPSVMPAAAQVPPRVDTTAAQVDSLQAVRPRYVLPELKTIVRLESSLFRSQRLDPGPAPLGSGSIAEWLRSLPGVQSRGRGPGGAEVLSIRGSRPQDVRVTLDGIPLDDPLTGAADLSLIPAASIEAAQLTTGAGAAPGWGGTAGALDLRSRNAPPGVRVRALAGSFGRRVAEAGVGWVGESGAFSLFGRATGARNDYAYENRIDPDRPVERRANADGSAWHLVARGGLERWPVTLLVRADGVERGAPGRMGNRLWDESRWREGRTSVAAGWRPESGRLRGSLAWSRTRQVYHDGRLDSEAPLTAQQLVGTGTVTAPHGLEVEWTGTRARVDGDRIESRTRWTGGVRVAHSATLGEALSLHGALTLDAAAEGLAVSPALGLGLGLGSGWRLEARASQARRLPTFADLFLRPGSGALPNPDLVPERVVLDAELGVEWSGRRASARAALFRRRTRDPIIWLPSVIAVWTPRNLGSLDAGGLELAATVEPAPSWYLDVAAIWQSSRVEFGTGASTPLPYEPRLSGGAALRFDGRTRALAVTLGVVGRRNTNLFGPHDLPTYALLDIRGRQTFILMGLGAELEAGVINLLDATYERVELFPEPGRRFEIGLGIATGPRARLPRVTSGRSLPGAAAAADPGPAPPDAGRRGSAGSGPR